MKYLPIFFDVRWRSCLVVGGGRVAVQKINALLNAGGRVTVVSPSIDPLIHGWLPYRMVEHRAREYETGDLAGHCLVVAATDNEQVQRRVAEDAKQSGIPCNVVDRPELSTFIMPAVHAADDLTVAVSTNGVCPGFARLLRDHLSTSLGPEYPLALRIFGALRERWRNGNVPTDERQRRFDILFHGPFLSALRSRNWAEAQLALADATGERVPLRELCPPELESYDPQFFAQGVETDVGGAPRAAVDAPDTTQR